jgi:hypothetical protein
MMQENAQTEEKTPVEENLITFADLGLNKDIFRSV